MYLGMIWLTTETFLPATQDSQVHTAINLAPGPKFYGTRALILSAATPKIITRISEEPKITPVALATI